MRRCLVVSGHGKSGRRANTLHVDGFIRADGEDVTVACGIARGTREHYIVVDISDLRV